MTSNTKHHRFFIDQIIQDHDEIVITNPAVIHQMRNVLRLRIGDLIILLDGTGTILHGRVKELLKKESIISKESIDFAQDKKIKKLEVNLYFSMIKKDKAEWVLQKCTELGVSSFHPVISDRTEKVGLDMERARRIIKEAAEQSERLDLPQIYEPVELDEALYTCETNFIFLDMNGNKLNVSQYKGELNIFVGPEGGFSQKDIDVFEKNGVKKVSLGEQILRAETASVAICSLLLLS